MDLHDQPVVEAHPRHFCEHLRSKEVSLGRGGLAIADARQKLFGRVGGEIGGIGRRMTMVGRRRAMLLEEGAPRPMGCEIARPGIDVAAGDLAQCAQVLVKTGEVGIDDGIRPIGRDHPTVPSGVANHAVPSEIVERPFGRGDRLDAKPLEQGARAKVVTRQAFGDPVVVPIHRARRERLVEAE